MKTLLAFAFILLCFALTQYATSLYVPAMPGMVQVFAHVTATMVMRTLLVFFVGYMIGQLFWGMMSDYYGRKRMVTLALCLYVVMGFATGMADKLWHFNVTYSVFGFAAAAFTSIGNAFIRDIFGKEGAPPAIAVVGLVMGSGPVIGPIAGAYLVHWFNWSAVFFCLAILGIIALVGMLCLVPETHQKANRTQNQAWHKTYLSLFRHPRYVGYLIILGCSFGGVYGFLDSMPFIVRHYLQADLILSGYLLMLGSLGTLLGAVGVFLAVKRFGIQCLLRVGLVCVLLGGVLLAVCAGLHSRNAWLVVWPMALATLGFGLCMPLCKAGAMTAFEQNAGAASSMMKFVQILLTNIVLLAVSHWHHANSLWPMAVMIMVLALIAVATFLGLVMRERAV